MKRSATLAIGLLFVTLGNSGIGRGEPATGKQPTSPHTPVQEQGSIRLADAELELSLVAAEPDVLSPVAMAWDAAGRLYVAEMIGYPATPGLGQIRRLEDKDGDGLYEHSVIFADKLDFPTGVMPYKAGILITVSPDILYLEDTNGDGKADIRRIEWTGFIPGSQQLQANALHWGLDNWIYGANGRSDYAARRPNEPATSARPGRARDFRINPLTGEFGTINGLSQFGLCHDDWGNRFLSWNTIPIRHAVIEEPYLADLAGPAPYAVVDLADPADPGRVFPISAPPRQFNTEQALYYNAMCGLTIYRGDALGSVYEGNAFVCESLTNLVTRRILKPDGPTFLTTRGELERDREFMASEDNWTHPVFLTTGPDGCLYIADFYREFVEHPQYVADKKARESVDFRHGADHGRIWKIRRKEGANLAANRRPHLDRATPVELVNALNHPVSWWRDTAQRLLVERQDRSVVPQLKELVETAKLPQSRLQALWTLAGLGILDDEPIEAALKDEDPRIRRSALNIAERKLDLSKTIRRILLAMSDDPDRAVRFQLALILKTLDSPAATDNLAYMLRSGEDEWINRGVLCGSSKSPLRLAAILLMRPEWREGSQPSQSTFLERLGHAAAAKGDAKSITSLLRQVPVEPPSSASGVISLLAGLGLSERGAEILRTLASDPTLEPVMGAILKATVKRAEEKGASAVSRIQSIQVLSGSRATEARNVLLARLSSSEPAQIQASVVDELARLGDSEACRAVYDRWQGLPASVRREAIAAATGSAQATTALLEAVESKTVRTIEVPQSVRDALIHVPTLEVAARARELLASTAQANRQGVIDTHQAVLKMRGDLKRGGALFKEHCATCHAVQGVGQKIGPDLASVGSRKNDILLVDILDPSRTSSADFLGYIVATKDGRVISGIVTAETAGNVTLRREGGAEETIPRSEIDQFQPTGKSLMPEGFEQKLNLQQFADLLEFLRRPDAALLK